MCLDVDWLVNRLNCFCLRLRHFDFFLNFLDSLDVVDFREYFDLFDIWLEGNPTCNVNRLLGKVLNVVF